MDGHWPDRTADWARELFEFHPQDPQCDYSAESASVSRSTEIRVSTSSPWRPHAALADIDLVLDYYY
jgi:hypothetical protein